MEAQRCPLLTLRWTFGSATGVCSAEEFQCGGNGGVGKTAQGVQRALTHQGNSDSLATFLSGGYLHCKPLPVSQFFQSAPFNY